MYNLKNPETVRPTMNPPLEVPTSVYLKMVAPSKDLIARVVRAEDAAGNRVGAGYIDSVRTQDGDKHVTLRFIINGLIYTGSMNWDETRFCNIALANPNMETVV